VVLTGVATTRTGGVPHNQNTPLGGSLGGIHQHGIGSYGTRFESAPIGEYCETRHGYGNDTGYIQFGSNSPYSGTCRSSSFTWIPADTALYVR